MGKNNRNSPDRRALAAELLGEHVQRLALLAAQCAGDADAFFVLLRRLVETVVELYALGELAREDASVGSQLQRHREYVAPLMRRPLADAKAAGALRRDTSLEDVFLVVAMARGAMARSNGATGASRGRQPVPHRGARRPRPTSGATLNARRRNWAGWSTHLDRQCKSC